MQRLRINIAVIIWSRANLSLNRKAVAGRETVAES